jgi:copper(I)-binding protein
MPLSSTLSRLWQSTLLGLTLAGGGAQAADIDIQDPWVRATVPGQPVAGGYMTVRTSRDARLVSARSALIPRVEIHEMKMEGGVMRMREMPFLPLAAGKPLSLAPGGYHLMLMDLKKPIAAGSKVPLVLVFEIDGKQVEVPVDAPARAPGAARTDTPHAAH